MALPPMTTIFKPSASHPASSRNKKTEESPTAIITAPPTANLHNVFAGAPSPNEDNTCGFYFGGTTDASMTDKLVCKSSSTCATNSNNVVACTSRGIEPAYVTACHDAHNSISGRACLVADVLCCNLSDGDAVFCNTFLWPAAPSRSMFTCGANAATITMQDFPGQLHTFTSSTKNKPTSSTDNEPSSMTIDSSDTSATAGSSDVASVVAERSQTSRSTPTSTAMSTNDTSSGLSNGSLAGIGAGVGVTSITIICLVAFYLFRKCTTQQDSQQSKDTNNNITGLQDHPEGSLPDEIAPPARHSRTFSMGWRAPHTQTESESEMEVGAGASEVPIDMRGQAPGAVELEDSPMAPIGVVHSQYHAYQTQAASRRYSQVMDTAQPQTLWRGSPM